VTQLLCSAPGWCLQAAHAAAGCKARGGFDFSLSLSLHANKWDADPGQPPPAQGRDAHVAGAGRGGAQQGGRSASARAFASDTELTRLQAEAERLQSEHVAAQSTMEKVSGTSQHRETLLSLSRTEQRPCTECCIPDA